MKHFCRKNISLLLVLVLLWLSAATGCTSHSQPDQLSLHMIDVGQGDSLLVITPEGSNILIDAGDPTQGERVVAYLKRQGVARIDHLVVSHPHGDHIGGLDAVLNTFPVSYVYMPPVVHTSQLFENLLRLIADKNIPLHLIRETTMLFEEETANAAILSTDYDYGDHFNNWSLMVRVSHGEQVFLMTGDAEAEAEDRMLAAFPSALLQANVLKAGHHGSASSSTDAFLDTVRPEVVLISSGIGNLHGHPHPTVLERLADRNIWIYRTDQQGSVVVYSDGKRVYSHTAPSNLPSGASPHKTFPQ
ncbi:MAG: ComEC/Rec2 family competence protein [Bacillota bacterium]|nr:ComEC/Rec2 family competence protein [Bacillota bacterium]MDW7677818.1 ComEC/Rec2 family competence protein [Bacillota bacterium]